MGTQELTRNPLKVLLFRDLCNLQIVNNRVQLGRMIRAGRFPAPIRISENRVVWRETDIAEWLDRQAAVSEGPAEVK